MLKGKEVRSRKTEDKPPRVELGEGRKAGKSEVQKRKTLNAQRLFLPQFSNSAFGVRYLFFFFTGVGFAFEVKVIISACAYFLIEL